MTPHHDTWRTALPILTLTLALACHDDAPRARAAANNGTTNNATNNGTTNNGVTNNGVTNNGVTNNGVTNNGTTNNGTNNATNNTTNNATNNDLPLPTMAFRIVNGQAGPLYVQENDRYAENWLAMFSPAYGLAPADQSCHCPCTDPGCDLECPAPIANAPEVAPGRHYDFLWDGRRHTTEYLDAEQTFCEQTAPVPAQDELFAVMCWGDASLGVDSGDYVLDPLCHTIPFEFTPNTVIEYTANPSTVQLAFVNDTDTTLYVQTGDSLGWPAWWTLADDTGRLRPHEDCGICECQVAAGCAVCGQALPTVKALAPGEGVTTTWRGQTWQLLERCEYPILRTDGRFDATFCWGRDWQGEPGEEEGTLFGEVTDVACKTVGFELGQLDGIMVSPD